MKPTNTDKSVTKKLLLSIASAFLAYRSADLVGLLNVFDPIRFSWFGTLAFSFTLNLFITGVFALLGFAFPTSRLLPNSYYRIKHPKYLRSVYATMGVEQFKHLLLKLYWGKEKNRKVYFNGSRTGLENFDAQTRQSEFGHLAAFISISIVSFFILRNGSLLLFSTVVLINFIGNLYPIVLQRYHRLKIERIDKLVSKREPNVDQSLD